MSNTNLVLYTYADREFYCTEAQAQALDLLRDTNKGGFGSVYGYIPESKWDVSPVCDIQFLSRFSTEKLYQRKLEALNGITFNDVAGFIAADPDLSKKSMAECLSLFNERKTMEMDSLVKTLDGDRDDAHRQGHDRCYIHISQGVKVNLVTEKAKDGLKYPVLHNGLPMVASIMLMVLELNRKYVKEGVRHVTKSGAPVRMSNAIKKLLNSRSVGIQALSLKPDNFTKLTLSGKTLTAEELKAEADADTTEAQLAILLEAMGL